MNPARSASELVADYLGPPADDAELEPPTKRAKRAPTKGKGRGRVGKLAAFNEMPLDVLGEVRGGDADATGTR